MNAINVVKKTVVAVPAKTVDIEAVTWRTLDDAFNRRLRIVVNGAVQVLVEGADYDALGQWTDETVKQIVLARLGLEIAQG